ncbi:putative ABC transporter ATP-binding protein YxlF [Streptomyces hundungensis]|uniref:Putative ABC transporter ATP-binding protein YxlF n=1 Tax=Streptomyces hundungensis TaxID=1077946 RepID=A0A387HSV7_9ACTN|nr:putative ABC transporter ATP-binding protein YxlF [Streptomyces hundungensis]
MDSAREAASDVVARVTDLVQGYSKNPVIAGLTIEIEAGVLGLLGPNGAGKTTLLRSLATVLPPRKGRIEILGEVIDSPRAAREARRNIGFLPQDFGYYPGFTVSEFVEYCAWLRDTPAGRRPKDTADAIERVGLMGRANEKMGALSGGMLRRAGIAAAMVGAPRLVIMDEPTAGLDPAQRVEFRELMRGLGDTAVVVSTHLIEDVASICSEIAVMAEGCIRFRGTQGELCAFAPGRSPGETQLERGYLGLLKPGMEHLV